MNPPRRPGGLCGLPLNQRRRLQAGAAHLHTLGPRVLAEILLQLADQTANRADLLSTLDDLQQRLTLDLVMTAGAHRMPTAAIRVAA